MLDSLKSYYGRYAKWMPVTFFLFGFIFDAIMLRRIDDVFSIVQQGIYLCVAGLLIAFDFLEHYGKYHPGVGLWSRIWKYREAVIHFMLGTLMNAYTIFYFKSASVMTSFTYVGVLVVILIVTEFKKFGGAQTAVHMALWNLCVISYSIYIVPILVGSIGLLPFLGSVLFSTVLSAVVFFLLRRAVGQPGGAVFKRVLFPFVAIHLLFVALYFLQAIPPVPLSVSFIGIYHDIKRKGDKYHLTYTDRSWKFWHRGDESFAARPNDRMVCFARIFSPARFHDQIMVRWLYLNKKNLWERADAIPLQITGGRAEGFRGYTVKNNYSPGEWRCQIETFDGREIGRITFHVAKDETTGDRPEAIDVQ
jgi:hypothetical protein